MMNEPLHQTRLSNHARKRQTQRGIKTDEIHLLLDEGACFSAQGGATMLMMTDDNHKRLREYYQNILRLIDRTRGKAAIVKDGTVITVMHVCGRVKYQ